MTVGRGLLLAGGAALAGWLAWRYLFRGAAGAAGTGARAFAPGAQSVRMSTQGAPVESVSNPATQSAWSAATGIAESAPDIFGEIVGLECNVLTLGLADDACGGVGGVAKYASLPVTLPIAAAGWAAGKIGSALGIG